MNNLIKRFLISPYYQTIQRLCSTASTEIDFSKLDPDRFGDLAALRNSNKKSALKSERLRDDSDDYDRLEIKRGIKISLPAYERILSEIYSKRPRNLNHLLETFHNMTYEDRYKPSRNIYTMIINACAQTGYTSKAFELYSEMKQRYDYRPTRAMITALFNSCANCSNEDDRQFGLTKALELRSELDSKGYHYNLTQYNVMIKTFALHGDQKNVDSTLKQMKLNGLAPNLDTYCMMMMGAIQNPQNGLFIATNLMRQILRQRKKIKLNISPFNLFLRSIRDCRIESSKDLVKLIGVNKSDMQVPINNQSSILDPSKYESPNLLIPNHQSSIVAIDFKSLDSVTNRFLLYGGVDGYLQLMDSCAVKPDLKTFTLMAELLSDGPVDCFEPIQNVLARYGLKPDICLYNVFIKIYAKQKNREKCEQMIRQMQNNNLRPDIMTFGALAFACDRTSDARKFLKEMEQCAITPNSFIMGTLVNLACGHQDISYVHFLLSYMQEHHIRLTLMDIERIEIMLNNYRQQILEADQRMNKSVSEKLRDLFEETRKQFDQMLRRTSIEIDTNTWNQWKSNDHTAQNIAYQSSIRYLKEKIDLRNGFKHKPIKNSELNDLDDL